MMRNLKFILAFLLCLCLAGKINGQAPENNKGFNWNRVIEAIIQVESQGDPNAYNPNGDCCGILQIRQMLVRDVNRISGYEKYSLQDRFDAEKSKEMFRIIQSYYNKKNDINLAIRMWNVGTIAIYDKNKGVSYYQKVMKEYNKGVL